MPASDAACRRPTPDACRVIFMLVVLLMVLPWGPARAAEGAAATATTLPSVQARQQRLQDYTPVVPELPASGVGMTPETRSAYDGALRAYYAYRMRGYEQRLEAFAWQGWSSKAIFFAVLLLVLAGIVFAAVQFGAGMRGLGKVSGTTTELAIDLKGVKLSSPVLGVVLLSISLAFFYLYLVYVYPIVNVF
jgi:hypothetical protein